MEDKGYYYFWDGAVVEVIESKDFDNRTISARYDRLCMDASAKVATYRWGYWCQSGNAGRGGKGGSVWRHYPYANMPKEFKLALVLMGVDLGKTE